MIVRENMRVSVLKPSHIKRVLNSLMKEMTPFERDKEHFWVFGLDVRNKIKYVDVVSIGTLNYNLVHPREVFRMAIHKGVASIIVAHNHPSGCLEPSDEDIALTKRLVNAGDLLGIQVLDHVISAKKEVHSFAMAGQLPSAGMGKGVRALVVG